MPFVRFGRRVTEVAAPSAKTLVGIDHLPIGMFKNIAVTRSPSNITDPTIINDNGYPTETPASDINGFVYFPSTRTTDTEYVLKWHGKAKLNLDTSSPGVTVVDDPATVVTSPSFGLRITATGDLDYRVVFKFNDVSTPNVPLYFATGTDTFDGTFRDLILCNIEDEDSIDNATTPEELIRDEFVTRYQELNPKVIRPMDMANPNFGNQTQSRYLPQWDTAINFGGDRWVSGAWAGETTGTDDYVASNPTDGGVGAYAAGEVAQLKFVNAGTSPMTLELGTRGAKPIYSNISNLAGTPLTSIPANTLATVFFDTVLDAWIYNPSGILSSIPWEYQIALANRIGCDIWLTLPDNYDDASITAVTELVRDQLDSSHNAYIELGNELWNQQFSQWYLAYNRGIALGFGTSDGRNHYGWQGLRTRMAMELVTDAWSPRTSSQLKRVMPIQLYGTPAAFDLYLFQGVQLAPSGTGVAGEGDATYNTYTGSFDYSANGERPIDWVDVISYATYFSGAQTPGFDVTYEALGATGVADLLDAADTFALGGPSNIAAAFAFMDQDIREGLIGGGGAGGETLEVLLTKYSAWDDLAIDYNKTIECYEGGYQGGHPSTGSCSNMSISTDYGGPTGKIADLVDAFKKDDLFKDIVIQQHNDYMAFSRSRTSAWLVVPGTLAGSSLWSMGYNYDIFSNMYKSWDAYIEINNG